MRPEQVAFLSFEGGGRAGLTIHPGVAQALSDLGALRYDEAGRQVSVDGFAGSSSGTVVATLLSCGYRYDELFMLLSEPAFDLVFRQEEFRLGQFSKLNGVCTPPDTSRVPPWIYAPSVIDAYDDPIGAVALNSLMHLQSVVEEALNTGVFQDSAFRSGLARRIDSMQLGEGKPQWLQNLVAAATGELGRELTNATVEWVKENRLKKVERDHPHVAYKLFEHVLNADNRVHKNLNNVFNIVKWDFGIFAGCAWRDFLDQIITFARFRMRYGDLLPTLTAPVDVDFLGHPRSVRSSPIASRQPRRPRTSARSRRAHPTSSRSTKGCATRHSRGTGPTSIPVTRPTDRRRWPCPEPTWPPRKVICSAR